ncbi:BglG family transcription antiterminator [Enterococcus casseliflavus]|uniref:BglG family transcription antiterminator n=1 Tax=Enterococcus casseliflavus TaxID=37734 RepID=UPI0022DF54F4|nr:BglG family transcription antiterminator [Enterococcus casseliflavus]MEB6088088.1 BglG family transcription antiterminator [Enterococcus casseliflavus]
MNISQRQEKILEKLSLNQQPSTAGQLSKDLGVSSKTIRNDIQQLNQLLEQPMVLSKAGTGFYLNPEHNQFQQKTSDKQPTNLFFDLLTRILDQKACDFYELAEEFFISESTLDRMVKELNTLIAKSDQQLLIKRKQNRLLIEGDEADKRRVFTLFLNQEIATNKLSLDNYSDYFEQIDLVKLSKVVVNVHQKEGFFVNDFSTISFILHLAVLLERISKKSYLNPSQASLKETKSRQMTLEMVKELQTNFGVKIPEEEYAYIYRLYSGTLISDEDLADKKLKQAIEGVLTNIDSIFFLDFQEDNKITDYLLTHVSALYKRATNKQYLVNPLLNEIKRKFPFVYNVSVYASGYLQEKLNIRFPEDEVAYLTLHFLSALENIRTHKKKRVLLISPYGVGNQRIVRNQLNRIQEFEIELFVAKSIFAVTNDITEDKSLILTTEKLNLTTTVPVYSYDSFLTDDDLKEIRNILIEENQSPSVLKTFLKEELFFPQKKFIERDEVIRFLCQELYKKGICEKNYVDKVLRREALSSTAFGDYYALPHSIKREAKQNAVAICSLEKPLIWKEKKVRLVLLLALKEERDNSFEQLFEELVHMLNDPLKVKKLSRQTSFQEFMAICQN